MTSGGERPLLGYSIPRQLPGPPTHFVNRANELSLLDAKLGAQGRTPSIVVLKGPGGMGKSAVALQWLHRRARDHFPDGQLYAVLAQSTGDPVAVEDVLGGFLWALGVTSDRIPMTLADRAALFRSVTADRSMAVLLEDAVSAAQVRVLLPGSATSVVAVTSRRALPGLLADGADVVPIDPLDEASSVDLLRRHVGEQRVAAEREPTAALITLCGGMPIALCVMAAQMLLRPHRPAARLVDELRDERQRLDVLSVEDDLSVRSTFDVSLRALSGDAASVYLTLGVHPGSWISPQMVAATNRLSSHQAGRLLDELVDASLLTEVDDRCYQRHDLVRAHAHATAEDRLGAEERAAVVQALLEWHLFVTLTAARTLMPSRPFRRYDFPAFPRHQLPAGVTSYGGALAWLERHRLDLAAVMRIGVDTGAHRAVYVLGDAMQPLFIVHRHNSVAAEVNERALAAAFAMGDPEAELNMLKRLANLMIRLGDTANAQLHIDEMFRRARQLDDPLGETNALESLARLQSWLGHHERAVATLEERAAIHREFGQRRSEALALIELGTALLNIGDANRAVTRLDRARTMLLEIDPPDPYNAAQAAIGLARASVRLDDHDSARRHLTHARDVLTSLDSDYLLSQAYTAMAELHATIGEEALAREHQARADDILASIADPIPDANNP